jgi:hypothetical protein
MNEIISAIEREEWVKYDELMNNKDLSSIDARDIVAIIKHLWVSSSGKKKSYILLTYLANKNLLDVHYRFSSTLLQHAIMGRCFDLVKCLLELGVDGISALELAELYNNTEILNILKEHLKQQEQINASAKPARVKK